MRQSKLFTKTRKEAPKDEVSKNAQLLIRAGYIHKEMAGVYSILPLGFRVIDKIASIIREEINAIGGQEIAMSLLQDKTVWEKSGRWSDEVVDNWFKSELKDGTEVGLTLTNEEPLANLLIGHLNSYKDLPMYIYQIRTKFRNELRAKSGIMRGREFLMQDLYSFNTSKEEFRKFYEQCAEAYMRIFTRIGIGAVTYRTVAAGGSFTSGFTDEFQTLSETGEDLIYLDETKKLAINKEIYNDENIKKTGLVKADLVEKKAIEVGNIFPLGTKYAEALGLSYKNSAGEKVYPVMGSYGIGLGRLMGTVVEVLSDEKGIVWPESITPFRIHLLLLDKDKRDEADSIYEELTAMGVEVLYDDRDIGVGEKFADADLLGMPWQVALGKKNEAGMCEVKNRKSGENTAMTGSALIKKFS